MYQSNQSFNILPPGIPWAFDAFSCPGGREFDHHSWGVGNLIASLDVMLRDKSWQRRQRSQTLMNSKEKICVFVADWLKTKGLQSCVPYSKVFKNDLYLQYINMCCLINHVYVHSFRSIIKDTEKLKQ